MDEFTSRITRMEMMIKDVLKALALMSDQNFNKTLRADPNQADAMLKQRIEVQAQLMKLVEILADSVGVYEIRSEATAISQNLSSEECQARAKTLRALHTSAQAALNLQAEITQRLTTQLTNSRK